MSRLQLNTWGCGCSSGNTEGLGIDSVVMGEWAVLGEMKDGRARRNQPACVLSSYIIIYSRVFLPEEKDHK